jgi:hypothetical protein
MQFSGDKDKNPVLVCHECVLKVDIAYAFRKDILKAEADHFRPRREQHSGYAGQPEGFDVCRVCLDSSKDVETTTIFKQRGENGMEYVEMIFLITDFNVSFLTSPDSSF